MKLNYLTAFMQSFAGRADDFVISFVGVSVIAAIAHILTNTPLSFRAIAFNLVTNLFVIALAYWIKKKYSK
jgi:hypothetical protein